MSLPSSSSGSNDNGGKSGQPDEEEDDDEEFYDADPLPILGRCRALYSFEGKHCVLLNKIHIDKV